ncbi:hypothetical protein GCM10022393_43550 [Aquimarina addita]|uniref:Leucine-rich repeat domain-containing protein n=1 Tax=Aquimarina addita TaxID=870485 RepID=A0ABP6UZX9_9FLAO
MSIEILRDNTIINGIFSPINFTEFPTSFTNSLRLILKGEINQSDAIKLSEYSKNFNKTIIVESNLSSYHFKYYSFFSHLYGFQCYGIDNEGIEKIQEIPEKIEHLEMGFLDKKNYSIDFLQKFKSLNFLSISGKVSGFQCLLKLPKLSTLNLYYVKLPNTEYFSKLPRLKSFQFTHGSIEDINSLSELTSIESISFWKVRGLNDLSWLVKLVNLKKISIGAQTNIEYLPSFHFFNKLESIHFEQMKNLLDISPISESNSIKSVYLTGMDQVPIESYESFKNHSSLEYLKCGYKSKKKRDLIKKMLDLPEINTK